MDEASRQGCCMAARCIAWLLFAVLIPSSATARDAAEIYRTAAEAYKARNWRAAADELGDLIAQHPGSQEALSGYYYAAESHFALKEYAVARRLYQSYLSKAPPDSARLALFHLGQCSYLLKDLPQAAQAFEKFLIHYPSDPLNAFVLRDLGHIEMELANYKSATSHFQRSVTEYPDSRTQDQCRRGIEACQRLQQATSEGIETAYRTTVFPSRQENADLGWREMAAAYEQRGDVTSAVESYCRALEASKVPHERQDRRVSQQPKPSAGT